MSNEEKKLSPKQRSRRNFLGQSLFTAGAAIATVKFLEGELIPNCCYFRLVKERMNITICGIDEISEQIDDVDCAISIVDPDYDFARPVELYQVEDWLLKLEIDDTWLGVEEPGEVFASEDDIHTVIDFVERCLHHDQKSLLIHCYQGISRSTAIAIAIYAYLGEPNPLTIDDNGRGF